MGSQYWEAFGVNRGGLERIRFPPPTGREVIIVIAGNFRNDYLHGA
jgi:hypothetical protein